MKIPLVNVSVGGLEPYFGVFLYFSLTKYVSMEYLKGSYSSYNTQATLLAPPHSPIPCDQDLVRISFVFFFLGTAKLDFRYTDFLGDQPNPILGTQTFWPAKPDFRYTDFLADQPNPILGTQTFWRADKTEKPKNRKNEKPKTQ